MAAAAIPIWPSTCRRVHCVLIGCPPSETVPKAPAGGQNRDMDTAAVAPPAKQSCSQEEPADTAETLQQPPATPDFRRSISSTLTSSGAHRKAILGPLGT